MTEIKPRVQQVADLLDAMGKAHPLEKGWSLTVFENTSFNRIVVRASCWKGEKAGKSWMIEFSKENIDQTPTNFVPAQVRVWLTDIGAYTKDMGFVPPPAPVAQPKHSSMVPPWSMLTEYVIGSMVAYGNRVYVALQKTQGAAPSTHGMDWKDMGRITPDPPAQPDPMWEGTPNPIDEDDDDLDDLAFGPSPGGVKNPFTPARPVFAHEEPIPRGKRKIDLDD